MLAPLVENRDFAAALHERLQRVDRELHGCRRSFEQDSLAVVFCVSLPNRLQSQTADTGSSPASVDANAMTSPPAADMVVLPSADRLTVLLEELVGETATDDT